MSPETALVLSILQSVPMHYNIQLEEVYCMSEAVFFEAATEGLEGQVAVANNIWNRVNSSRYPDTICGVTKQKSQYSYYWDGKPETINLKKKKDLAVWTQSIYSSIGVINGWYEDNTKGALFYYNPKLAAPSWAKSMKVTVHIGDHMYLRD